MGVRKIVLCSMLLYRYRRKSALFCSSVSIGPNSIKIDRADPCAKFHLAVFLCFNCFCVSGAVESTKIDGKRKCNGGGTENSTLATSSGELVQGVP